jgi:predicted ATPase
LAQVVELASASDEAAVLATFTGARPARDLGFSTRTHWSTRSTRRMLIVLDNCEHVLGIVAEPDRGLAASRMSHCLRQPRAAACGW